LALQLVLIFDVPGFIQSILITYMTLNRQFMLWFLVFRVSNSISVPLYYPNSVQSMLWFAKIQITQ